jgi:uncharacterized membrane protein YfcA
LEYEDGEEQNGLAEKHPAEQPEQKKPVVAVESVQQKKTNFDELDFYKEKFPTVPLEELVSMQYTNFGLIVGGFLTVLLSALVRGGDGRPSIFGLQTCSGATKKVVMLSQLVSCGLATVGYVRNKQDLEQQSREAMTTGHDRQIRNRLFLASYVTGLASGIVGVGGGMILSIYMLSLGMDVLTSGALSIFAILFSSCSTTFQSIIAGGIQLRHAYAVMLMSLVGSVIGNCCLRELIKKLNRPSIILWILLSVLLVAAIAVPYQTIESMVSSPKSSFSFGKFC